MKCVIQVDVRLKGHIQERTGREKQAACQNANSAAITVQNMRFRWMGWGIDGFCCHQEFQ